MIIEQIITERFINLVGDKDRDQKEKYKDQVFDMLQQSYKDIGGIKGSGFDSADDMVDGIPFWKLAKKDGKIVAVVLYKDKQGRKAVASGTDGSITGKRIMMDIVADEPSRSYAEKSKSALNFFIKTLGEQRAKAAMIPVDEVEGITGEQIIPVKSIPQDQWPIDDDELASTLKTMEKYPFLRDYGYFREMGGNYYFKVMAGTPFLKIQ
jgi:hypothetical protein